MSGYPYTLSVDADDITQAIEIACGNRISGEFDKPRTAAERNMTVFRATLLRLLRELPEDATVGELKDAMEGNRE